MRPDLELTIVPIRPRGPDAACRQDHPRVGRDRLRRLFLALAEDAETVMITADARLLKVLEGTSYAHLAHPLSGARQSHLWHGLRLMDVQQPEQHKVIRGGQMRLAESPKTA